MPTLTLIFRGQTLAFDLAKIDRDRLYGYVETETVAPDGSFCASAVLAGDGHTLAGPGDTALCYLSPDGFYRTKDELHSVDARDGAAIVPAKPTFAFPVDLTGKVAAMDDYLSHNIRLVYRLVGERTDLHSELEAGTIFTFPFSYRGGDSADAAFLIGNADGIFLAVGTRCSVELCHLNSPATVAEEEEEEEEADFLDFSVM